MSLFHAALQPALDSNGDPISGAKWWFYVSGTSTAAEVFGDADFGTSLGTSVEADADGTFPPIYLNDAVTYRAVKKTAAGATINNSDIDPVNGSSTPPGRWVTVDQYRYNGAVIRTDTEALNALAAAVGDGVNGLIDGDFEIDSAIIFDGKSNFKLVQNGLITIADGTPTNEPYSAFHFIDCEHVVVEGIRVDGNRDNRTTAEDSGHLIKIKNSKHMAFHNCEANNGICDGWFIFVDTGGAPTEDQLPGNLHFENCWADNNWRNGCSIIDGYGITFIGGGFTNTTGSWDDASGPGAGIDIEPDNWPAWIQDRLRYVRLYGVLFSGNQGFGLQTVNNNGIRAITVQDCVFLDNQAGAMTLSGNNINVIRPYIEEWDDSAYTTNLSANAKRGLIDIPTEPSTGKKITIDGPIFRDITATSATQYLIYQHASASPDLEIRNIDVKDVAIEVLHLRGVRTSVKGGLIEDCTKSGAVNLIGADALIEHVSFVQQTGGHITTQGVRAHVRFVSSIEPTISVGAPIIRLFEAGAHCSDCKIYKATPAAGIGISWDAAPDNVSDNTVTGITGDPLRSVAGMPTVQRGNIIDGVGIESDFIALTDAATITPNLLLGRNFTVTLGGSRTLANPTNMRTGQKGQIVVTQDATGSRTLSYGAAWRWEGGSKTLTTTANAVDVIDYEVVSGSLIYATLRKAYAA